MADGVDLIIDILTTGTAKATAAIDGIANGIKKINEESKKTNKAIQSLTTIIGGISIAALFKKGIDGAIEQEKAINRLNTALKTSGSFTQQASKDFIAFAESMERSTALTADAILNQVAMAKSFGATNDQAKKIVETATNVSAALGIDLSSATKMVSQTLQGMTTGLSKAVPELKQISENALKAGVGVDILALRFEGFAKSELNTFSGLITQATNAFNRLLTKFGEFVVNSEVIKGAIGNIIKSMDLLGGSLSKVGSFLDKVGGKARNFIGALADRISGVKAVDDQLKAQGFIIEEWSDKSVEANKAIQDETKKTTAEISKLVEANKKLSTVSMGGKTTRRTGSTSKLVEAELVTMEAERQKNFGAIGQGVMVATQGRAGAGALVSGAGAFGADMILPGSGQFVGPILQLLGQSSEELRQNIRGLADGAVDFVLQIVENVPVIIEELANATPRIIDRLANNIGPVIASLARSMPQAGIALAKSMPMVGLSLSKEAPNIILAIISEIPNMVEPFSKALVEGAGKFVEELIKKLGELFKIGKGGLGKAGDLVGGALGGVLGGASGALGGVVGGVGGAVISGGASVISGAFGKFRSLPDAFQEERSNARSINNENIQVINTQVKFKSQVLADIMIELNRTGVRTIA